MHSDERSLQYFWYAVTGAFVALRLTRASETFLWKKQEDWLLLILIMPHETFTMPLPRGTILHGPSTFRLWPLNKQRSSHLILSIWLRYVWYCWEYSVSSVFFIVEPRWARNSGDETVVVLYLMLLFLREVWIGLDSRPVRAHGTSEVWSQIRVTPWALLVSFCPTNNNCS